MQYYHDNVAIENVQILLSFMKAALSGVFCLPDIQNIEMFDKTGKNVATNMFSKMGRVDGSACNMAQIDPMGSH